MKSPIGRLASEAVTERVSGRIPQSLPEESVVLALAEEMRDRWERGERPLAEEFLRSHPELMEKPDLALDLVYEEVTLRQKFGLDYSQAAIVQRFPQWRAQIAILFECHQMLEPEAGPVFPEAGDHLGDFHLVSELGRGAVGRVFLATQTSLAHRVVVLKLTPRDGREHLSLARLQHTWIVPLYDANIDAPRRLRWLCLPYFGGMSLTSLMLKMAAKPLTRRVGRDVLEILDDIPPVAGFRAPKDSPMRELFANFDFVQVVCSWGVCLAEALQYAHDRGLLHLDVKPSNILIAGDGQPMLLDFHLAHEPLRRGATHPGPLGGTPATMPREQYQAMRAVQAGAPVPCDVDQRADVYGLAASLYETLGGTLPYRQGESPPLNQIHPGVSQGLSDLFARALEADPEKRLSSAGALAADLRRHLQDEPLLGVPNRSWRERWQKWRRRRPTALRGAALAVGVVAIGLAFAATSWLLFDQRREEGESALLQGREQWRTRGQHEQAIKILQRGLDRLERLPFAAELQGQLNAELQQASDAWKQTQRLQLRQHLHEITDQMRGLFGVQLPPALRARQDETCRQIWDRRGILAKELDLGSDDHAREDFLDLFLLWLDGPGAALGAEARLAMAREVEAMTGSNAVLQDLCRQLDPARADEPLAPRSAWEHFALGRQRLLEHRLEEADTHLRQALKLRPGDRWFNASFGLLAYRMQRFEEASIAFAFCVGSEPNHAVNHYNLGLALEARGQLDLAIERFDRAIAIDPSLADAWLQRGLAQETAKRWDDSGRDLVEALNRGAAPVPARLALARIALAQGRTAESGSQLQWILRHQPNHAEARALLAKLKSTP